MRKSQYCVLRAMREKGQGLLGAKNGEEGPRLRCVQVKRTSPGTYMIEAWEEQPARWEVDMLGERMKVGGKQGSQE